MTAPQWRPDLAAEIALHTRLRLRPEHLGPQVAGLAQGVGPYLAQEPRLAAYATTILSEAQAALPYRRRPRGDQDYQGARAVVGRRHDLDSEPALVNELCLRWGDALPLAAFTACIWVVRRLFAIHRRRHGPAADPWAASFVNADRTATVAEMAHTLWGGPHLAPRHIQEWRRGRV